MRQKKNPTKISRDLLSLIKGRVLSDPIARYCYATDASIFRIVPDIVVQPRVPEDIQSTLIYANEHGLPVAARGAGTGLAGESLTTGIVIDCSVFLNKIGKLDTNQRSVTLEPGVVPDLLNQQLAINKILFGPDPSTSNRCTIGGMIANNAAGAHSLKYGMTNRWIKSLDIFLSDGSNVHFSPQLLDSKEVIEKMSSKSLEGQIYRTLIPLLRDKQPEILSNWPDLPRNRHGYLLKEVFKNNQIDFGQLICASEGTLGVIWQAEIELANITTGKALLCLAFYDRLEAADATSSLLKFSPAAIELIDEYCLDLLRTKPEYQAILAQKTKALLLVEFQAKTDAQAFESAQQAKKEHLASMKIADSWLANEPKKIELFWNMRKHISAMLNKMPGERQPIPIIEDVCVHPKKLRQYLQGVDRILAKSNLKYLAFGHAGDGVLHVRPFLNRHDPKLGEWLPQVCSDIYDLALELGGSISGEHGDGLLRSPFISKQYGPLFELFKEIKKTFDPNNILNPGKKTDCNDFSAWKTSLRFSRTMHSSFSQKLNWPNDYLLKQVEACNGCGACRNLTQNGYFCPAFKAFGQELASARAKANVMRALLAGELSTPDLANLHEITQYCLNCKKCESECPAGVSAASCNNELRAQGFAKLTIANQGKLISMTENFLPRISPFSTAINFFVRQPWLKAFLPLIGIAKARTLPCFAGLAIKRPTMVNRGNLEPKSNKLSIVYFADMASYYLRHDVADALLQIARHNQIDVVIPPQRTSGLVPLTYGNIKDARKLALYNLEKLLPYAQAGYQIVCSEPSTVLMLQEEYRRLVFDDKYLPVFNGAIEACTFFLQAKEKGLLNLNYHSLPLTLGYHQPCHLRRADSKTSAIQLLASIPDLTVKVISQNCCGIAGTFGMRQKYYRASIKIGEELFVALKDPTIDYGLTECSACQMQMEHGVPEKKTLHPLQILAVATGLGELSETAVTIK